MLESSFIQVIAFCLSLPPKCQLRITDYPQWGKLFKQRKQAYVLSSSPRRHSLLHVPLRRAQIDISSWSEKERREAWLHQTSGDSGARLYRRCLATHMLVREWTEYYNIAFQWQP